MKYLKYKCLLAIILGCSLSGCFDLTEEVFDRVDSGVYYQDENSVKSAVAKLCRIFLVHARISCRSGDLACMEWRSVGI